MTTILGVTLGVAPADASPAQPILCPNQEYLGHIHNGSDYLDSYGGGSGEYVHTYRPTSSTNQLWCIEKAASSGDGLFIHPYDNPSGLCLDSHTDNPGQKIWLYTCNGSDPQRWCWNGTGYIVRHTNAVMALKDNGTLQHRHHLLPGQQMGHGRRQRHHQQLLAGTGARSIHCGYG